MTEHPDVPCGKSWCPVPALEIDASPWWALPLPTCRLEDLCPVWAILAAYVGYCAVLTAWWSR